MYFHHVCKNFSGVLYLVAIVCSTFPEQSTLYIQHCSETWSFSSCPSTGHTLQKAPFQIPNQGSFIYRTVKLPGSNTVWHPKGSPTPHIRCTAKEKVKSKSQTVRHGKGFFNFEPCLGTKTFHSSLNIRSASNPFQIHVLETSCSIRSNIDTSADTTPNQHQVGRQVQETPHNVASSG